MEVDWEFEEYKRVGPNVVCRVKKRNCGTYVFVYENVPEDAIVKWRNLEFSMTVRRGGTDNAPAPVATFPPTPEGMKNAVEFARMRADMAPVEEVLSE